MNSTRRNRNSLFSIGSLVALLSASAVTGTPGRPIVSGGTVRTSTGDLLRGGSLHISKTWFANNNAWGASPANLRLWRDQIHYNTIRLCMVDPWAVLSDHPDQAFSTVDETFPLADAVVNNAESLGIYIILDYHCPNAFLAWKGAPGVEWSAGNFWKHYAPRYKDKPFVLYEMYNEGSGCPAPWAGVPHDGWVGDYKTIRSFAPNNIVLHCTPACMEADWGPWLKNTHAPSCGFRWEDGKDVFAFHTYDPCLTSAIKGPQALGIPVINTEFSYPEAGWYSDASLGGCKYPAEWCERNGVSWMDWYSNNAADQSARIKWIVPDAVNKGWAWWTATGVNNAPYPAILRSLDPIAKASGTVLANGRIRKDPMRKDEKYRLSILPRSIEE